MGAIVERMNCMRYDRSPSGQPVRRAPDVVERPSWPDVQAAIRRMENFCFPIITLSFDTSEQDGLIVVGGPRRYSATRVDGSWIYERPGGGDQEVRLWDSDQGFYCRERNILRTRRKTLEIAKAFYETGDFEQVAEVARRPEPTRRRAANQPLQRTGAAMTLFDLPKETERGPGR
jgi:hypothetical protein